MRIISRTAIIIISSFALIVVCGTTLFSAAMVNKNAATAAAARTVSSSNSNTLRKVFCFGDSLTAGTSPPERDVFPYAKHLEEALSTSDAGGPSAVVRWRGYPGWTASALLTDGGLSAFLDNIAQQQQQQDDAEKSSSSPPVDLVIILAGTNDLAYVSNGQEIFDSIQGIHDIAHSKGCKTIALGIPPSGWQMQSDSARSIADDVNTKLESWSNEHTKDSSSRATATFVPFPIQEFDRNSGLWSPDGLHFSPEGYKTIGESLAPILANILCNDDDNEETS